MGLFSGISKAIKAISPAAGIISGGLGFLGGEQANKQSAQNAATANAFTEEQLKNRHQWEVSDLKKAGLNPILSAHGAASIGSSAQAQTVNSGESAAKGLEAGTKSGQLSLNKQMSKAQIALMSDQAKAQRASAMASAAQAALTHTTNRTASVDAAMAEALGMGGGFAGTAAKVGGSALNAAKIYANPKNLLLPFKALKRKFSPKPKMKAY